MAGIESRCVRIAAPGGEDLLLGSGFRLSATRVLTAWHVVKGLAQQLERPSPTPELACRILEPHGREWTPTPAKLCWPMDSQLGQIDAVLLATDPVSGIEPWGNLLEQSPPGEILCRVVGFPDFAQKPEDRRTVWAKAVFHSDTEQRIQVTPEGGNPEKIKTWAGLSGSPVLTRDDYPTLLGVFRGGLEGFAGRDLEAVPLTTLMVLPGFREELGSVDPAGLCAPFVEEVGFLINAETAAFLVAHEPTWQAVWKSSNNTQFSVGALARAICLETDLEAQSQALAASLSAAVDTKKYDEAARIYEIVRYALPAAYVAQAAGELPDRAKPLAEVPVVTKVLLEITQAAIDGRPVSFYDPPARNPGSFPSAFYNVTLPLERSIDPQGQQRSSDLMGELAKRLALKALESKDQDTHKALEYLTQLASQNLIVNENTPIFSPDYLDDLDASLGGNEEEWARNVSGVVNQRLEAEAKKSGRFYYVMNPNDPAGVGFLKEIRKRLPSLRQVRRVPPPGQLPKEDPVVRNFNEAHRKHRKAKEQKP